MASSSAGVAARSSGADGEQPQRGVGEEVADVDGRRALEALEVLGHAAPAVVELGLGAVPARELRPQQRHRRVVDRRERQTVLSEHLERDALVHLAGVVGMREQLHVGVRVHVDEAGREREPVALERAARGLVDAADGDDAVAAHADVGPEPGVARAVDHAGPAEAEVEHAQTSASRLSTSSSSAMRTWPGREPAVDREHGAAHERRLVRGQEQHGGGHLVRRADAPERIPAREPLEQIGLACQTLVPGRRADRARRDRVGAHAVPAVARGDRPAEVDQARLGRAVGLVAVVAEAVHGGHADDRPAAALDHSRQDGADAQEGARERSVHVAPPRLVVDRDEVVAARRERVVDEHVDAPAERALDVGRRP